MIGEAFATGGSVAVVLGLIKIIELQVSKHNHKKNGSVSLPGTMLLMSENIKKTIVIIERIERRQIAQGKHND